VREGFSISFLHPVFFSTQDQQALLFLVAGEILRKRQTLLKSHYGAGTLAREGVLPYTGREGIPVPKGLRSVTRQETGTDG
jgi:hypothetical protein